MLKVFLEFWYNLNNNFYIGASSIKDTALKRDIGLKKHAGIVVNTKTSVDLQDNAISVIKPTHSDFIPIFRDRKLFFVDLHKLEMDSVNINFIVGTSSSVVRNVPTFPMFLRFDYKQQFCTFHTLKYDKFCSLVSYPDSPNFQYVTALQRLEMLRFQHIKIYNSSTSNKEFLHDFVSTFCLTQPVPKSYTQLLQQIQLNTGFEVSQQIQNGEFIYIEDNAPEFATLDLPSGTNVWMHKDKVEAYLDTSDKYCAAYSLTRQILVISKQPAIIKFNVQALDQVPPIDGSFE